MNYDVFNGDADGILSLLQLRKAYPKEAKLITGVKRDIQLLQQINVCSGDEITVLDLSMAKNKPALLNALTHDAEVFYADHHQTHDVPNHPKLTAHIHLESDICTGLIIDSLLEGQFRLWAITSAFGDNLNIVANKLAQQYGLDDNQSAQLQELGILINYNGYGASLDDLCFHPADLYQALIQYDSPFDVIDDLQSPFHILKATYAQDMQVVESITPTHNSQVLRVIELPNKSSSRRVSGVLGNQFANQYPEQAHLILTQNVSSGYTVSLRAPRNKAHGAADICSQFTTGGGRAAAAGINQLDVHQLERLIAVTEQYYAD